MHKPVLELRVIRDLFTSQFNLLVDRHEKPILGVFNDGVANHQAVHVNAWNVVLQGLLDVTQAHRVATAVTCIILFMYSCQICTFQ